MLKHYHVRSSEKKKSFESVCVLIEKNGNNMIFIACQLLKKIRGQYMDLNVLKIIDLNCTFYCC